MKQSKSKKRENTAAIYPRISRDDNLHGDSNSIANQKKLLIKAAKDKGYTNILTFVDDGVTGTTLNRPGFNELKQAIIDGKVSALFVKDSSRVGRNYIEAGEFTEIFLVEHDIRLVSVSEGVDTAEGEDDFGAMRHVMNDYYAKDISRKRRAANYTKGVISGEPLGFPPFGYMKNPDSPKFWVIDPEAAEIVKRIYRMTLDDDMGTEQIATALHKEGVMTPTFYYKGKGIARPGTKLDKEPDDWNNSTVIKILTQQEYCGDVVNFKTYSKSYKLKKRLENPKDKQVVLPNVHEPIIDRATWEKVQAKRNKIRKRTQKSGERNMFSGLLICADCGGNMNFHFNQGNHAIHYFNCWNNNKARKTCATTHYVRVDFLELVVIGEINRLTKFAKRYEQQFAEIVMGQSQKTAQDELGRKKKELSALKSRDREIDKLYESLYESNIAGKISDERFNKMSRSYEQEQAELMGKMKALAVELETATDKAVTADMFLSTVRKYTRTKKLTPRMLHELVERIEVYDAQKIDGVWAQRLRIHYHCVGEIVIPEVLSLPVPEVSVNTRKGVTVVYEPGTTNPSDVA